MRALSNVSLEVKRGGVFTLLGRNGAGKTTFLRIASTQLLPTRGQVFVFGYDVVEEADFVREDVAVLPQEAMPIPPYTPWDHVYHTLVIRGVPRAEAKRRALEALEELELLEYKDRPADRLSGGLRQRTLVAMALATKASLLFLDEPTLGLDPVSRRRVWEVVRERCRSGSTIVLTTHYLDEAEVLSDEVAILDGGKVLTKGSVEELKAKVKESVKVEVVNGFSEEELTSFGRIIKVADRLKVLTDEGAAEELLKLAVRRKAKVRTSPISLEDLFVDLCGPEDDER